MWWLWVGRCIFWPVQPEMGPLIAARRDSPEELSRAVGGEVVWSQLALGLVLVCVSRTLPRCQKGSFRNEGLRSGWATQPSQTRVQLFQGPHRSPRVH